MLNYLRSIAADVHLLRYPDHHYFTETNLEEIQQTYKNWDVPDKIIVTTEKDATRLMMHRELLASWNVPIGILPISIDFRKDGDTFDSQVKAYIDKEQSEMYL
jgi:tetraacyldisaccharide 4'-kinase